MAAASQAREQSRADCCFQGFEMSKLIIRLPNWIPGTRIHVRTRRRQQRERESTFNFKSLFFPSFAALPPFLLLHVLSLVHGFTLISRSSCRHHRHRHVARPPTSERDRGREKGALFAEAFDLQSLCLSPAAMHVQRRLSFCFVPHPGV